MGDTTGTGQPHTAIIALMSAADRTRRELVRVLQPFDLTLQQFNVLIILRRANADGLPTLTVAARLVEQTPGITRLMNTLSAKSYIRRRVCGRDRRQQLCALTKSGVRVIDSVIPHVRAAHLRVLSDLTSDEWGLLVNLLDRVSNPHDGAELQQRLSTNLGDRHATPGHLRPTVRGRAPGPTSRRSAPS